VRIACIDIGRGTSDLMIAPTTSRRIDDSIRSETLHQDGISLAGDQLEAAAGDRGGAAFAGVGLKTKTSCCCSDPRCRGREYRAAGAVDEPAVRAAARRIEQRGGRCDRRPVTHNRSAEPAVLDSLRRRSTS
jgi:hypothetical protein